MRTIVALVIISKLNHLKYGDFHFCLQCPIVATGDYHAMRP